MPGVSLVASAEGIIRARKALKYLNMTQMSLVNERGIASWSTINNFFNGKPVKRQIFIEICEEINLNWQDIVASFKDEDSQQLTPIDQLWQQLQTLGSPTEQMGLVLVTEETLAWGWHSSVYEKSVRVGSYIQFKINFETPGYLLLLQKDTSGQMCCFCPSCFAPQPKLETGKTSLPQEGSPITSFPIEGAPGKEEILAVITQDISGLQWLPQENDDPLELEASHLIELLKYITECGEYQVWYTDYMVTAQ
ncbi:hypothetical protein NIES4075_63470 [Tolypothrix sp. NIES-4075]|uniref:DUF4384 domain-containing protein n=1 Tax=Tolypothrix sp. NIES-4075 TaxID=2005459 RepID=UPI000B5C8612|nr:DUF4384 domain-containing protein [Tolypothrix sp. NIES-4075]GAX45326.1 hypothetical protein NIES4075_63470 [Tolypothrix sp. NIES-4075]